jgi:hypothetical protein
MMENAAAPEDPRKARRESDEDGLFMKTSANIVSKQGRRYAHRNEAVDQAISLRTSSP